MRQAISRRLAAWFRSRVIQPLLQAEKHGPCLQVQQKLFVEQHSQARGKAQFADIGFSVFSEFEEDGILLFIFTRVGAGNRRLLEIGCGDGTQNNSSNLLVNHGWTGLLIDSDEKNCQRARTFYGGIPPTKLYPPTVVCARVTPDNVLSLVEESSVAGESLDLVSIDIDSTDVWVLERLATLLPRVIVAEVNARWAPGVSMTTPRDGGGAPVFDAKLGMVFGGASLAAFQKALSPRGYRLIGSNQMATNVFFMRQDVGVEDFPAVAEEKVLLLPRALHVRAICADKLGNYAWINY